MEPEPNKKNIINKLKEYREIPWIIVTILAWFISSDHFLSVIFFWIAISILAILISEIAEVISEKIPQPFDSLILTLAAVGVEVLLIFMVLKEWINSDATLIAKNWIISAVLVDINILFWLSLFIWWLVWKEQKHNEDSSEIYTLILLVVCFVLMIPSIFLADWNLWAIKISSNLIAWLLLLFYIAIIIFQTKTHVHFFKDISKKNILRPKINEEDEDPSIFDNLPTRANISLLIWLLFVVWYIAEQFSHDWIFLVDKYSIPLGIAWIAVALISVFPELFTTLKAAKNNEIQKVVNISLWASVVSILITIPFITLLSEIYNLWFDLTLNHTQILALTFTVLLAWRVTNNWETDYLKWISHLVLFMAYLIMVWLK